MRRKILKGAALAMLLVVATATVALADQVAGDADSDSVASPHPNGVNTTQSVGTPADYDYSAHIKETGNANDDVLGGTSDTVTASVSITQNSLAWPAALDTTQFVWNAYEQNRAGKLTVTVPAGAADGTTNEIKVTVTVTNISNGRTMSGGNNSVTFNYTIEADVPAGSSNAAPTVLVAAADALGTEGDTLGASGSFEDADDDALTLTADNSVGTFTDNGDGTWSWSLATSDDVALGTIIVTADDGNGGTVADSFDYEAINAEPDVSASFAAPSVSCGTNNATLDVDITDPGTADTHSAVIDWGDGTDAESVDPIADGDSVLHTYGAAGEYTATITVTDDDGGVSDPTDSSNTLTVIYNTSGILQPVNWTQAQNDPSIFKYGSTIPVKVRFSDCDGTLMTDLHVKVAVKKLAGSTPATGDPESIANTNSPDSGGYMRWADTHNQYNLNTKSLTDPSATYEITLTVEETGQTVSTQFGTKAK